MKLSKSLWQTYKDVPADAEIPSHQLMLRAGLIHKSGAGLYNYMPFAFRSLKKIESIIRQELDKVGCQELLMSVVTPAELWKESGRWDSMGEEMLTLQDKAGRDLCISPTNEEVIVDVFRKNIKSYKQLPQTLYQINTKFRDEIRPRFGLMRAREFTMKDAYSFHNDKTCLDTQYDKIYKAYEAILERMGLEFSAVVADGGAMASSDSKTHEFQVIADSGEDEIIYSKESGYAANIEKACTKRACTKFLYDENEIEEVQTKEKQTIKDVCDYLNIPQHQSLKTLVYKYIIDNEQNFCLVTLLGDDELNELKLKAYLGADHMDCATDNELVKLGLIKGNIAPYNNTSLKVIFDSEIDKEAFYCVGANKENFHLLNFNPKRDLKDEAQFTNLRLARMGDLTEDGKFEVSIRRGIEVGHIFQLGEKYTSSMKASILDKNGKATYPLMGCYGLGVTRIMAACIEQNFDENGIVWPKNIAPFHLQFIAITKSQEMTDLAEELYTVLLKENLEVLYDDRKAGPGFKFKDADLLGLPLQVVLGERDYLKDELLEIRVRKTGEKIKVTKEELVSKVSELLGEL